MKALMLAIAAGLAAAPLAAQDFEVEISFYLQPDSTGDKTENRFLSLEDGELTIEAHNSVEDVYDERDATDAEIALLLDLVSESFASLEITGGERIDYPYIEVDIEFDGGAVSAELEYDFPVGDVPEVFVALQKQFFVSAFR